MKACKRCGEVKPLSDYYKHNGKYQMADGHLNICKVCIRKQRQEHRVTHADKIKAYERTRYANPERVARREAWKAQHKKLGRKTANTRLGTALRNGSIQRPDQCSACGISCTPEGHHDDYSKPLEVRWLCRSCHCKVHAGSLV